MPVIRALRDRGCEVVLVCPFGKYINVLRAEGFKCIHWSLDRRSINPLKELFSVWHLIKIYKSESPSAVHHFTIKPNLYGSISIQLLGLFLPHRKQNGIKVINTFTGLGYLFSSNFSATILRTLLKPFLRIIFNFNNVRNVTVNKADSKYLNELGLSAPSRISAISGEGINTDIYRPANKSSANAYNSNIPVIIMACRMLWDKGVKEYVDSAQLLINEGVRAEFWLVGEPDSGNPGSIPENVLKSWNDSRTVKWYGHREDMPELLRKSDIAVLPTYYQEGVPLFLLESASTGLPLIATDIESCKVVVKDNENGIIVPPKDVESLSLAIKTLIKDSKLRCRMGKRSRYFAEKEFDEKIIINQYLDVYEKLEII